MTKRSYMLTVGFVLLAVGLFLGGLLPVYASDRTGSVSCGTPWLGETDDPEFHSRAIEGLCQESRTDRGLLAAFILGAGILVIIGGVMMPEPAPVRKSERGGV